MIKTLRSSALLLSSMSFFVCALTEGRSGHFMNSGMSIVSILFAFACIVLAVHIIREP